MYKHFFKRLIGFLGALVALIILSPLLIVVTIWLHFANKKGSLTPSPSPKGEGCNWLKRWLEPVIFTQERPGKDEKIFKVIKFKSMTEEKDAEGNLLPDAMRLTKVGAFVRKTSIDELPQLINILKGDMAFIGPRPLLVKYLPWYTEREHLRHSVRPGISGWAQVHGRSHLEWDERLEHDVYYAEHISLWLDIKIFVMSVINVFAGKDIDVAPSESHDLDVVRGNK